MVIQMEYPERPRYIVYNMKDCKPVFEGTADEITEQGFSDDYRALPAWKRDKQKKFGLPTEGRGIKDYLGINTISINKPLD